MADLRHSNYPSSLSTAVASVALHSMDTVVVSSMNTAFAASGTGETFCILSAAESFNVPTNLQCIT